MSGISDWVEKIVGSKTVFSYRRKVNDAETASMWQGMTCGVSNKCPYCMAVCPAEEEIIGPCLVTLLHADNFLLATIHSVSNNQEIPM